MGQDKTAIGDRKALMEALQKKKQASEKKRAFLIVISGPDAGEMFPVEEGGTIGRGEEVPIHLSDTEASREHARLRIRNERVEVEDLQSTNGTFVNGELISSSSELNDGDRIQIGSTTILKFSYQDDLEEEFQRRMYNSAVRDGLTGAFNKRHLDERLTSEFAFAERHGTPLSLLLLDLDHFKALNDNYGHLAGDYALATFAKTVSDTIRKEDFFARYGGEEFAIVSRGLTGEYGRQFGERLIDIIHRTPFEYEGQKLRVTVSIGVGHIPNERIQNTKALIAAADKALYAAKDKGRDRVEVMDD